MKLRYLKSILQSRSSLLPSYCINYKMLGVSPTVTPHGRRIRRDTVKLMGILFLWTEHIQSVSEDIAFVAFAHKDRQIEKNPRLCQFRVRFSRNTVSPKIGYRTICRVLKPVWE